MLWHPETELQFFPSLIVCFRRFVVEDIKIFSRGGYQVGLAREAVGAHGYRHIFQFRGIRKLHGFSIGISAVETQAVNSAAGLFYGYPLTLLRYAAMVKKHHLTCGVGRLIVTAQGV